MSRVANSALGNSWRFGTGFGEGSHAVRYIAIDSLAETFHGGNGLCTLEINCSSVRFSEPTWRLATLRVRETGRSCNPYSVHHFSIIDYLKGCLLRINMHINLCVPLPLLFLCSKLLLRKWILLKTNRRLSECCHVGLHLIFTQALRE